MKSTAETLPRHVALSALAAAAGLGAIVGWTRLAQDTDFLWGPLLLIAVLVATLGSLGRWRRVPLLLVLPVQLLAAVWVLMASATDTSVPSLEGASAWISAVRDSITSAQTYAAPVSAEAPSVVPLLVLGGAMVLVAMDLVALALRHPATSGLVLLAAHVVPALITGQPAPWAHYVATAVLFLALIAVQHDGQVGAWGRSAGQQRQRWAPLSSVLTIGIAAIVLGLAVPLVLPRMDASVLSGRGTGSGAGPVKVVNPMVDLRRDLTRGRDLRLLRVTTSGPRPSYLRLSVLNRFTEDRWTPGDREIPASQAATGPMPALDGVAAGLERVEAPYEVKIGPDFDSTWLPTTAHVSEIDAGAGWRYDLSTRDFIAAEDDLTTASLDYTFTGVNLRYDAEAMDAAGSGTRSVPDVFTELPDDIDDAISGLAASVTADAPTRFQKAQALQRWFRHTGGFRYDLAPADALGDGAADLVAFLDAETGRVGYCEQFAAAMALMARTLDIPSRVAVGFLGPTEVAPGTWEFSAWDLHAWPELYFPGSGWVAFEPTPSARTGQPPGYTTQQVEQPTAAPTPTPTPTTPTQSQEPSPEADPEAVDTRDREDAFPWRPVLATMGGLALLVLVLLTPRTARRMRRRQRLDSGMEGVWRELRATVQDLGLSWPRGLSPRQTGAQLDRHLVEAPTEAAQALDRLVHLIERDRYAADGGAQDFPDTVVDDLTTVEAALGESVSSSQRQIARWLPRSFMQR